MQPAESCREQSGRKESGTRREAQRQSELNAAQKPGSKAGQGRRRHSAHTAPQGSCQLGFRALHPRPSPPSLTPSAARGRAEDLCTKAQPKPLKPLGNSHCTKCLRLPRPFHCPTPCAPQGPISSGRAQLIQGPHQGAASLAGQLVEGHGVRAHSGHAPICSDSEPDTESRPESGRAEPAVQRMRQREAFSSGEVLGLAASPLAPSRVPPGPWCWALGRP